MPENEQTSSFTNGYETYRNRAINPPAEFETSEMPFCNIDENGSGAGSLNPWLYVAAGVVGGLVLRGLTTRKINIEK